MVPPFTELNRFANIFLSLLQSPVGSGGYFLEPRVRGEEVIEEEETVARHPYLVNLQAIWEH